MLERQKKNADPAFPSALCSQYHGIVQGANVYGEHANLSGIYQPALDLNILLM